MSFKSPGHYLGEDRYRLMKEAPGSYDVLEWRIIPNFYAPLQAHPKSGLCLYVVEGSIQLSYKNSEMRKLEPGELENVPNEAEFVVKNLSRGVSVVLIIAEGLAFRNFLLAAATEAPSREIDTEHLEREAKNHALSLHLPEYLAGSRAKVAA